MRSTVCNVQAQKRAIAVSVSLLLRVSSQAPIKQPPRRSAVAGHLASGPDQDSMLALATTRWPPTWQLVCSTQPSAMCVRDSVDHYLPAIPSSFARCPSTPWHNLA